MKPNSLEAFYAKFSPVADVPGGAVPPPGIERAVGHFNVFNLADLMPLPGEKPPMLFDRWAYHKISLCRGHSRVEYADRTLDITRNGLFLSTPRVPYSWVPLTAPAGYFCIFNEAFLLPAKGGVALDELSIFQPGAYPVWEASDADYAAVEAIFQKMAQEIASDYAFKYDLLRNYLWELIHLVQKLQPAPAPALAPGASARVAARFANLLDQQFPLESPQQQLRLRSATDYADQLAVHVNHLNKVLKDTTGHTTTKLISSRLTQEAKMLLKQLNWTVSEIAASLGFASVAHFCTFFKRQTGLTPGDFRH